MARWHKAPEVLNAARRWRDSCLQADGSILSEKQLWTLENLAHLDRYFLQNFHEGSGTFFSKLEVQLTPAPPSAKQLAAELLWIMYLCVSESAIRGGTKRLHIRKVWLWSGEPLPEAPRELGPVLDEGVANPGPGYNNHKWREFAYAIQLTRDWKQLPPQERQQIIDDPWLFAEWVDGLPSTPGRQFRHMLLYLLFPDQFERMVTGSHKRRVVEEFFPLVGRDLGRIDLHDRTKVDKALYDLRPQLEERFGADGFDYYLEPVRSAWLKTEPAPTRPNPSIVNVDLDSWYAERFGVARVWAMSAGEGARLWPDFQNEGVTAIGWDYLGDLASYDSREAVHEAMQKRYGGNPTNDSLACWQFANEIQQGDHVIVKQGRSVVLGHGVVTSDYQFDENRAEYQHTRSVKWQRVGRWTLPDERHIATKTLTSFTLYKDWLRWFFEWMNDSNPPMPDGIRNEYKLEDALRGVFMSPEQFSSILDALARKKNAILEGPPGVGKTFLARRIAWALMGEKDNTRVEMVQFHQSYAYEDFVQGWRPSASGGFELKNGVFHQFCRKAQEDPDRKYVFIIDEINRGNLSKVFGELMMLIETDKRGPDFAIPLTYSGSLDERFYVPDNLYVLGLMNTADRSLAMVDYALRRRFSFVRLTPQFESESFTDHLVEEGVPEPLIERIVQRMSALNLVIIADGRSLGPGFVIGHSFFVPGGEEEGREDAWYEGVIRHEIEPLLNEYWFDQPERVKEEVERLLA